jgi:hypothetical protein
MDENLIVNAPSVLTRWALIEHRLTLIDTSKLHRVVAHLRVGTFHTRLFDSTSYRIIRARQGSLLGIALGPKRRRSGTRVCGCLRKNSHFGKIRLIRADITGYITRTVHFERSSTVGTKGPCHGEKVRLRKVLQNGYSKFLGGRSCWSVHRRHSCVCVRLARRKWSRFRSNPGLVIGSETAN